MTCGPRRCKYMQKPPGAEQQVLRQALESKTCGERGAALRGGRSAAGGRWAGAGRTGGRDGHRRQDEQLHRGRHGDGGNVDRAGKVAADDGEGAAIRVAVRRVAGERQVDGVDAHRRVPAPAGLPGPSARPVAPGHDPAQASACAGRAQACAARVGAAGSLSGSSGRASRRAA